MHSFFFRFTIEREIHELAFAFPGLCKPVPCWPQYMPMRWACVAFLGEHVGVIIRRAADTMGSSFRISVFDCGCPVPVHCLARCTSHFIFVHAYICQSPAIWTCNHNDRLVDHLVVLGLLPLQRGASMLLATDQVCRECSAVASE